MTFWLAVGAMTLLAVALVAVPASRTRPREDDAALADQARRLRELEADVAAGELEPAQAAEVREELERSLLAATPQPDPSAARGGRAMRLAVAVLIPAVAIGVYYETGEPRVAEFAVANPDIAVRSPEAAIELLLAEVRERTVAAPQDREAWAVLARTNLELGRYDAAVEAAEALYRLAPEDPNALLLLVDAEAMRGGGRIAGRAATLVDTLLALDPGNTTGLVLKGIAAREAGDVAAARGWWQHALDGLAADSPLGDELRALLGQAGEDGKAPAASTVRARVQVDVALDETLADAAAPGDTVWVIARAVEGPSAPLAVSRHAATELPLSVTLDDTMAMMPGASIADFPQIYLVARVSRSGGVRPASGDLEGRSAPLAPAAQASASVTIDRVLP